MLRKGEKLPQLPLPLTPRPRSRPDQRAGPRFVLDQSTATSPVVRSTFCPKPGVGGCGSVSDDPSEVEWHPAWGGAGCLSSPRRGVGKAAAEGLPFPSSVSRKLGLFLPILYRTLRVPPITKPSVSCSTGP